MRRLKAPKLYPFGLLPHGPLHGWDPRTDVYPPAVAVDARSTGVEYAGPGGAWVATVTTYRLEGLLTAHSYHDPADPVDPERWAITNDFDPTFMRMIERAAVETAVGLYGGPPARLARCMFAATTFVRETVLALLCSLGNLYPDRPFVPCPLLVTDPKKNRNQYGLFLTGPGSGIDIRADLL